MQNSANKCASQSQGLSRRPYLSVGAGPLASFVWKDGNPNCGFTYRFNLFRMQHQNGRVAQQFAPKDIRHFVKLVQVLAAVIADDGCLSDATRRELMHIADGLDRLLAESKPTELACESDQQ